MSDDREVQPVVPSALELETARDEFRSLLNSASDERDWQHFFEGNPFVLSMSLPLKLEPHDIIPMARRGKTEPDFIFYPKQTIPAPYYGLIELKTPSSRILSRPRANTAILSRDAETAIGQARAYGASMGSYFPMTIDRSLPLFVGNRFHAFVILGMSAELTNKLSTDLLRDMVEERLPAGFQLIPYDTLLKLFENGLMPTVHVLVPRESEVISQSNFPTTVKRWAEDILGSSGTYWFTDGVMHYPGDVAVIQTPSVQEPIIVYVDVNMQDLLPLDDCELMLGLMEESDDYFYYGIMASKTRVDVALSEQLASRGDVQFGERLGPRLTILSKDEYARDSAEPYGLLYLIDLSGDTPEREAKRLLRVVRDDIVRREERFAASR